MKNLIAYAYKHIKSLLLFVSFGVLCAVVFTLYDVPAGAILYSLVLCAFAGIIVFTVSFISFNKRHNAMERLRKTITVSLDELPEPKNLSERDYDALIRALFDAKRAVKTEQDANLARMKDYYSLWAHQIKTPIAAAKLLIQSSDDAKNDAELLEQLSVIERYVEMALLYARTENGVGDYYLKKCDIDSIVRGVIHGCARSFILKRLTLDFKPTDLITVTDEKWLSFVIGQIISNSLKYTVSGGITIYKLGEDTLVIKDTGIGISEQDLPLIFGCGYTGYNGHEDKRSTGIGLYLCKRVCNGLGHAIRVESQLGKGTRVMITFDSEKRTYE